MTRTHARVCVKKQKTKTHRGLHYVAQCVAHEHVGPKTINRAAGKQAAHPLLTSLSEQMFNHPHYWALSDYNTVTQDCERLLGGTSVLLYI